MRYQHVAKQLESTYGLIQEKVTSRFYRETTEIELVRSNLNRLLQKSIIPTKNKTISQIKDSKLPTLSNKKADNHHKDNIDWTRGRFSGQIVQIIVIKGQVIEKVFLTPKGNLISVKRRELGLLARLSLRT
ncbi:hypothetical protein [Prochlorococcus sp. MIT 1223]|uniref:hypothetical protein n=1 Tax=Prochlorococcus sp. MIT 1223 TaxID=3096217 RepID=UPI002A753DD9|nr:hypothetical protein [Prochlorococcus sp. MIT 1223]